MTPKELQLEATRFFEISKAIFYLAYAFMFVGLGLGLATDITENHGFLVVNDLAAIAATIVFFALGLAGKITRGVSLGISLVFGLYLLYIEIFPPGYSKDYLTDLFLFNMILVAVYSLLGGFLLDKRMSIVFGISSVAFVVAAWIYIDHAFLDENIPLLILVVAALALLLYYYRGKLESLAVNLIEQKNKAEDALKQLQVAQKQIIVQEKLASLGALTAGIAHEIKNPLNFVNNFAQSSVELIKELEDHFRHFRDSVPADRREDVEYLLGELSQNMKDIESHGKRGNGIVMSMLDHSRTGESVKRPSNLHNLLTEAWGLSYHGFRARENNFSAEFETDFDSRIDEVTLVPHEMSRVFLNIFGNGLYAARKKLGETGAKIRVQTRLLNQRTAEIRIRDNGAGIPSEYLEKVFTPFFTTKPTGEGTGLGLSISYDIVTAGHQGSLSAESSPGEYTEFVISLPVHAV